MKTIKCNGTKVRRLDLAKIEKMVLAEMDRSATSTMDAIFLHQLKEDYEHADFSTNRMQVAISKQLEKLKSNKK